MIPAKLTPAERIVFARAADKVDRVIGPKRIAELLAIFEIDSGTTTRNVLGAVPAGVRQPANADRRRAAQAVRRIPHPDNAPCKFDSALVDVNGACLKCGAGEAEDCRDI